MPGNDFIVSQVGFADTFYYLIDYIQKTSVCGCFTDDFHYAYKQKAPGKVKSC